MSGRLYGKMNDLLKRRDNLSDKGIEVFILPGGIAKYYTETYHKELNIFPLLELYTYGDDYSKLFENALKSAEKYLEEYE